MTVKKTKKVKKTIGEINPYDFSKTPHVTIAFRGVLLVGDGYLSTKMVRRGALAGYRYVKEVNEGDILPMIQLAFRDSPDFLDMAIEDLIPSVLVQDEETNEFLMIPKKCYWW